ncbi:hypothetical protein GRZ55_10865 [Chelativorans sp. ZYF759]|uniref:hypothetical protein n=1 Tax=Chelativorans sp. ZYF759 TaxID=2692213 RepID=UPI00145CB98A|nr:hypothetical protein [Chelativorans sp. ZYF759]NMG39743.1 hypothetical protein [Chelativorans sp. ZYF759]
MTIPTHHHHKAGARLHITGRATVAEVMDYSRDNGLTAEQTAEVLEGWQAARDTGAKSLRDIRWATDARPMTDEEFLAHWDALIEAAALEGDEAEVERLMLALGEAITIRYPG